MRCYGLVANDNSSFAVTSATTTWQALSGILSAMGTASPPWEICKLKYKVINLHQIHTSLLNGECCLSLLTATLGFTDTLTIMNWLVCCQIRLQIWQTSRFCKFSLKLKTFSHQYLSLYISFKKEIIEHLIILVPSADTCPTIRWLDQYRRS